MLWDTEAQSERMKEEGDATRQERNPRACSSLLLAKLIQIRFPP